MNPIQWNTVPQIFTAVISFIKLMLIPIGAGMVIYAAFLYITAGGSPQKATQAHQAITWTVIGIIMVLIGSGVFKAVCDILGVVTVVC